jgi:hypothetical protein
MKNSFIFYESFLTAIEYMPTTLQLEAYKTLAYYALKDEMPNATTDPIIKMFFAQAQPQIDANAKRAKEGTKGGRPLKKSPLNEMLATTQPNHNYY